MSLLRPERGVRTASGSGGDIAVGDGIILGLRSTSACRAGGRVGAEPAQAEVGADHAPCLPQRAGQSSLLRREQISSQAMRTGDGRVPARRGSRQIL